MSPGLPSQRGRLRLARVAGQPSWRLASDTVEAWVTETGGHLGPVVYGKGRRRFSPFGPPPWAGERPGPGEPNVLRVMRGDFFCLPFGGNETPFRGERHPPHGETANSPWMFEGLAAEKGRTTLHLSLQPRVRKGRVDKFVSVADGHDAVYSRHVVSGMAGPMSLGHHAILRFPDRPGSGLVATSPFLRGQVAVEPVEEPSRRGYSMLFPGAGFASLERVPTVFGGHADLTAYPARRGYEDIVLLAGDPAAPFAWTAVTFPRERRLWLALKNPRVLRQTLFWMSNGGRHYPPWSGRHVNVMGLEEVTSYFHYGLARSVRPNPLSAAGSPTSARLSRRTPLEVNYIMAAVPVPAGFGRVASVERNPAGGGVLARCAEGRQVRVRLDLDFLGG